jgi:EPS-associated MarR family transcriptional regulator
MTRSQQLQEDMRFRVLSLLESNPSITQRELAVAIGVSLGRVNYGLRALVEKGLIKVDNFKKSEHKLAYAYLLTPRGMIEKTSLTQQFLARKMQEYEALRLEIESLQQLVGSERRSIVMHENGH